MAGAKSKIVRMSFLLDRIGSRDGATSAVDQEERGGRSIPRTRTQRGGRATPAVSPVNKAIASTRISVARRRMRQMAVSIGAPAAGHSGHGPITMPTPIGMISRISRRTSPTISTFRATTLTVAPAVWIVEHSALPGVVPFPYLGLFKRYRDVWAGLVVTRSDSRWMTRSCSHGEDAAQGNEGHSYSDREAPSTIEQLKGAG